MNALGAKFVHNVIGDGVSSEVFVHAGDHHQGRLA